MVGQRGERCETELGQYLWHSERRGEGVGENEMERSDEEEGRACDVYPLVRATWS